MLSIAINSLLVIHVVVSLLIILVVLMQRPKSEGLGAAFGGGMTENLFGAQTTNVLQKFTRFLGGLFFALTLILSVLYAKQANIATKTSIQRQLSNLPAPVIPPVPAASASPGASASPFTLQSGVVPLASATPAPSALASPAASASPMAAASPSAAPEASATAQPNASAKPSPTASPSPGNDGQKQ